MMLRGVPLGHTLAPQVFPKVVSELPQLMARDLRPQLLCHNQVSLAATLPAWLAPGEDRSSSQQRPWLLGRTGAPHSRHSASDMLRKSTTLKKGISPGKASVS